MSAPTREALHPGRWTTGPTTATASFQARDVLHRTVTGTLPVRSAVVEVGPDGRLERVQAELELAGVDTGSTRRDHDLQGKRFLHVELGGVLLFTADSATATATATATADGWTLPGELDLHGARCPVVLRVQRTGPSSVRATATLHRQDLGIRVPRLIVGSLVTVTVDAELAPPST